MKNDLQKWEKKLQKAKARIHKIGFICQGSITERYLTCGTPSCNCHTNPDKRHGPYYQLSWKENNKTVSRFIAPEHVPLFRKWSENRKKLMAAVEEMLEISRKAGDSLKTEYKPKSKTAKRKRNN